MLSDSKDEKVPLEKEIEYLNSYIELQRLRISDKVSIHFNIEGNPEPVMIEPLLLIPFVENAFKHGVSYLEDSLIEINLRVNEKDLHFTVENKIVRKSPESNTLESGIGLKNVLRRLELIYPGTHEVFITENNSVYHVDLKIILRP